jgi:Flp pilus assembly protein TadD
MSLLLQALQKASKHREGAGADPEPTGPPREPELGDLPEAGGEPPLSLADADELFAPEPEAEPDLALASEPEAIAAPSAPAAPARPPERPVLRPAIASGGAAQAASILRASESRSTGVLDRIRDRPVHATLIFAVIFSVFYGTYLYLAINHPGVLRGEFPWSSTPRKAPPKRPVSQPSAQAQPAPANTSTADAAAQARGPQPMDKPMTGLPQATANTPSPKDPQDRPGVQDRPGAQDGPRAGLPVREPSRRTETPPDMEEDQPRAARRAPAARRGNAVDVEATTLEDSVAVRPPPVAPTVPGRTLMQAWEALQQGRYEEARKLYQEVMQADPQNVDALLGLAALAAQAGNAEEAGRNYARALELEPRNSAAQAGLISIIGQADPQQSETRLKQLISREPSAFLYFALGNLYARQGLWAQAQPAFFQAYESQPDNPDYAYNLAIGLEHLNQPKIALNYYRRALELSSLKGHAGFDQARVQERIGQLAARVGSQ